jgi:UPF0716 protein FxsA
MLVVLLLLLSAVILELYVMVQVASVIGALPTVLLIVAISLVGAWLTKIEGLGVLRRMQRTVQAGELPADEAVDGLLVSAGGMLMLVPGFISGIVGFLLLLPPVRVVVRPFTRGRIRRRFGRVGSAAVFGAGVYNVDSRLSPDPSAPPGSAHPHGRPPELEA